MEIRIKFPFVVQINVFVIIHIWYQGNMSLYHWNLFPMNWSSKILSALILGFLWTSDVQTNVAQRPLWRSTTFPSQVQVLGRREDQQTRIPSTQVLSQHPAAASQLSPFLYCFVLCYVLCFSFRLLLLFMFYLLSFLSYYRSYCYVS